MVTTTREFDPEAPLRRAGHILFVEGRAEKPEHEPFDRTALGVFLDDLVRVEALGPSFHLRSAAEALHPFHPTYYFLIDRDHHDDAFVAQLWARFPDPATHNLLVWPRRELENYFLDPAYLLRSEQLSVDEAALRTCIRDACQRRLYLDAANQVITECRESLKNRWITQFNKIEDCPTREAALIKLRDDPRFLAKREAFATCTTSDALTQRFLAVLEDFTGGHDPLEFGSGRWLERVRGKEVWPTVAARCFRIADARGRPLQGPRKQLELAKALLRHPLAEQPADLQQLRRLLAARVRAGAP